MLSAKWFLPLLCAGGTLCAQSMGDLNGLALAARHYVAHGMAGEHDTQPLELTRMTGSCGADLQTLLHRGVEVTHWQFQYRVLPPGTPGDGLAPCPHHEATADCDRGVFGGFKYSQVLVTDARSLEYTWIAISLDDAIAQLKKNGYIRGFSTVTLLRPTNPSMPEEYVYVFDCPLDKAVVGISTQTGALTWAEHYR